MKRNHSNISLSLTLSDSNILKGVALLFLLVHHLFYIRNGRFDDIEIFDGHYLVNMIGLACKVCVPMFVFLSGYGLTASAEKLGKIKLSQFYIHRFTKLYFNYWLIWLLFVPIGVFVCGLTFDAVYGEHVLPKFLLDFLGLINIFGLYGYNPTWWFYSCIIVLYLLFPFIVAGCKHRWCIQAIFWVSLAITLCPFTLIQPIRFYLITFVLGCFFRNGLIHNILPPLFNKLIYRCLNGELSRLEILIILVVVISYIPLRLIVPYALVFDTIITILLIFLYKNIKIHRFVSSFLHFCGKHSFNIFLFHTFLFYLYIPQIIYWHRNPVVIFTTLILFCLLISCLIEEGKKKLGYYKILQTINSKQ